MAVPMTTSSKNPKWGDLFLFYRTDVFTWICKRDARKQYFILLFFFLMYVTIVNDQSLFHWQFQGCRVMFCTVGTCSLALGLY